MIGNGTVGKIPNLTISNLYVNDGFKHNLFSSSQFYDKRYEIVFNAKSCVIKDELNKVMFVDKRIDNIYSND